MYKFYMNTCRMGMGKLVAMDKFSEEDRLLCVELVIKNSDSATLARREFCKIRRLKNDRKCPSLPFTRYWVKKFKETGSAKRQEVPPREKPPGHLRRSTPLPIFSERIIEYLQGGLQRQLGPAT